LFTKRCPKCKVPILKDEEGCSKIECKRCGERFCWTCLEILYQVNSQLETQLTQPSSTISSHRFIAMRDIKSIADVFEYLGEDQKKVLLKKIKDAWKS
jgi:IBR domain, a half RING-finger domain